MTTPEVRAAADAVDKDDGRPDEVVADAAIAVNDKDREDVNALSEPVLLDPVEESSGTFGEVLHEDSSSSVDLSDSKANALASRIQASRKLPKGLRDRLGEIVELSKSDSETPPVVAVAEAVAMIEAAIPEQFNLAHGTMQTPAHPHGEHFFHGQGQLSDEEASRIAEEQIAATGFSRRTY